MDVYFKAFAETTVGYNPYAPRKPGHGTTLQKAREAAYRKQQAERLKDAAPEKISRQQLRRQKRMRGW